MIELHLVKRVTVVKYNCKFTVEEIEVLLCFYLLDSHLL